MKAHIINNIFRITCEVSGEESVSDILCKDARLYTTPYYEFYEGNIEKVNRMADTVWINGIGLDMPEALYDERPLRDFFIEGYEHCYIRFTWSETGGV